MNLTRAAHKTGGTAELARQALPPSLVRKRQKQRRRQLEYLAVRLMSLVVVLAAWEIYGRAQIRLIFAPISEVIPAGIAMIRSGALLSATWYSLETFFVGSAIGVAGGILLGLLMARFALFEAALGVYTYALYATPMVTLVPLITLWAGFTFKAQVTIVTLFVIFPVLINTFNGAKNVDPALLEVGRSFRASEGQMWRHIVLPSSVPFIMTGLSQAVAMGLVGVIVGELFTALAGLGAVLSFESNAYHTARVLVVILTVMILGVFFRSLLRLVQNRVAPWFTIDQGG